MFTFPWVFEIIFFFKKTELADEALHSKTVDKTTQESGGHTYTHKNITKMLSRGLFLNIPLEYLAM